MRDPTSWFQSHYYFERYGWERKKATRATGQKKTLTDEEINMTIDECVAKGHNACTNISWKFIEFFCGTESSCKSRPAGGKPLTNAQLKHATLKAKINIRSFFYTYGILEQWDDTLALLEAMLPRVYKNVQKLWKTPRIQAIRNSTKSKRECFASCN